MASTSPYQNNDYQAVSTYRPYSLPINDIFKAYTAQNKFWDEGAAQVKRIYDNALGMSLTSNENKKVRDDFMKAADEQIVKLSSMDLADPTVQRKGLNIFTPLLKDKAINYDNALTKLRTSIFTDAESYKNKKLSPKGRVGEGYNETNLMDALDGFEKFNANTPRDSNHLEGLYNSLAGKGYQPYYDYSKEMTDIVKNCKGITTQEVSMDSGFITTISRSGANALTLQQCLDYGLSEQARNQIDIEGRRAFKNPDNSINYGALSNDYNSMYQSNLNGLRKMDEELLASAALYQKLYNDTLDPRYKEAFDFANKQREENADRIKNLTEGYEKIRMGDSTYVDRNYSSIASSIYKNKLIDGFSTAFQNPALKKSIDADPYELMRQRLGLQHDYALDLQAKKHENDKELERIKAQHSGKKLKPDGTVDDGEIPINPSADENNLIDGPQMFLNKVEGYKKDLENISSEFYHGHIKSVWEQNGGSQYGDKAFMKPDGTLTDAALEYLTKADLMGDQSTKNYLKSIESANLNLQILGAIKEGIEQNSDLNNITKEWREKLLDKKQFPDYIHSDGTVITALDIQNALEGKSSPLKIVKGTNPKSNSFSSGNIPVFDNKNIPDKYYINGKEVVATNGSPGYPLHELTRKVTVGDFEKTRTVNQKTNELYNKAMLAQEGRVTAVANNTDDKDPTRSSALGIVNNLGSGLKMENISILSKNPKTGRVSISITKGSEKSAPDLPSSKEILQAFRNGLDATADNSKLYRSVEGKSIVIDITNSNFIDPSYKSNSLSTVEDQLNGFAAILQTHPDANVVGKRMENKKIFLTSPKNGVYQITPYKSSAGNIVYEVKLRNEQKTKQKGEPVFDLLREGQTGSSVISLINN